MPNPQDIFQLAQQTATQVTASPENWRRVLYTAAHNYHTTYLNQLLIHAQRPDATACATMQYWNEQAHRKVMYGSKSIIILQRHQGVPTAKRVFSMTDTVLTGDKVAAPWEVTDAIRPLLMDMQVVSYIVMVEVLPFLGLGFIHRDGYPFEKLVKIYWAWHSENAAVPIRPYKESRNVQKKRTRRNSECETYCRRDEKAARKGRKAAVKAAAQIRKTIRNECRAERPQH